MAIEVTLEGTLENEDDFEGYMKLIQEIAVQNHLKMEIYEDSALIEACPEGYIEINCENLFLSISAQTNVSGAGFHAFVCDFFQQIQEKSPLLLTAGDPTGYYEKRNFNHLKYGIFHRWLSDIALYVKEHENTSQELCISWPLDYYQPKHRSNCIVTPLGYMEKKYFYEADVNELAERFFIWNHMEKDALFYRNAALNLLWKECYFMYSNMNEDTQKQADTILDLLEIAYEKDNELPLPFHEYKQLCEIRGRKPMIIDAKEMNSPIRIGYRYDVVEYRYDNWSIPADGFCEKSFDYVNQVCYLTAPYQNEEETWRWMYRIEVNDDMIALSQKTKEWEAYGKVIHWENQSVKGIATCMDNGDHFMLEAVLESNQEHLSVQIVVLHEEDTAFFIQRLQEITYRRKENVPVQA